MAGDKAANTPTAANAISAFDCPACGGSVRLTARGITVTVYCTHCGAEIDANNDKMNVIRRAYGPEHTAIKPVIELGTRGTLKGVIWEAIGFLQRSDKTGYYKWQEYLLFNPAQGFRWLIENQGHWTLFRKISEPSSWHAMVGTSLRKLEYQKRTYELFERGDAIVCQVLGEFYWRVRRGDVSKIQDLIAPPHMLSHEVLKNGNDKESLWSQGEYIEPDEIQAAFSIQANMPPRYGPGPAQPNTRSGNFKFGVLVAVLFSIVMLLVQMGIEGIDPLKLVHSESFVSTDANNTRVGDAFAISRDDTVLRFDINSNVSNRWAELDIELVNDDSGETRHVNRGVEYWSGYEDGYYWHEGDANAEAIVSPVSKGSWHINADYSVGNPTQPDAEKIRTTLEVFQGAYGWSNFLLALLALWLPVAGIGAAALLFDMNRWSLSDFSPYQKFTEGFE